MTDGPGKMRGMSGQMTNPCYDANNVELERLLERINDISGRYFVVVLLLMSVLGLSLLQGCSTEPAEDAAPVDQPLDQPLGQGDAAPAWTGTDLVTGESLEFPALLQDNPAVLVFWATWCPYCKAFMPYAEQIRSDYAELDVQIVTFNAKERGKGDPKAYIQSLAFPMIAIADADAIAEQYDVKFIPGLMVVDGSGQVTYRRGWTELPAGQTVAQQWDGEVRAALDVLVGS